MGFLYTASQDAQTVSTSFVLFQITAATDVPIVLHWLELGQTSDLGDAQEEVWNLWLARGGAASDGASLTPVAIHDRAPAATATVRGQGVSVTASFVLDVIPCGLRIPGPVWIPLPNDRPRTDATNNILTIKKQTAPLDAVTLGATICWEEL